MSVNMYSQQLVNNESLVNRIRRRGKPTSMGWVADSLMAIEAAAFKTSGRTIRFGPHVYDWVNKLRSHNRALPEFSPSWRAMRSSQCAVQEELVSLEMTLANPEYFRVFETFLEDNGMPMVLDFLEDVQDFKSTKHQQTKVGSAQGIFDVHVNSNSHRAIDFPPVMLRTVELKIAGGRFEDDLFDEMTRYVTTSLRNGNWRRFAQSPQFVEMLPMEAVEKVASMRKDKQLQWREANELNKSVHVDIISARELFPGENVKSANTHCLVSVGSKLFKTKVRKNTFNPVWEEHFEIPVANTSVMVKLQIMDGQTQIGVLAVFLCDIAEPFMPDWYVITPPGDAERISGEIHVRFKLSPNVAEENKDAEVTIATTSSVADAVRGKVSKKKKRFKDDGFNLDLTYITDHIIAMGYPSQSLEGLYRNNLKQVKRFLNTRHGNHFMIYNLCSERAYDLELFQGRVKHYGFDDHNPCPFNMIMPFCKDVMDFHNEHPLNVVSIHCKAGKGRTGLLICCYMIYCGMFETAEESLNKFATERTKNDKGVTIPSQKRYVRYTEMFLHSSKSSNPQYTIPDNQYVFLRKLRILNPSTSMVAGKIIVRVNSNYFEFSSKYDFSGKECVGPNGEPGIEIDLGEGTVPLNNDFKVTFMQTSMFRRSEKLFHIWLNSRFLLPKEDYAVHLDKHEIDKAVKDKKNNLYPKELHVDMFFDRVPDSQLNLELEPMDQIKELLPKTEYKPKTFNLDVKRQPTSASNIAPQYGYLGYVEDSLTNSKGSKGGLGSFKKRK